MNLSLLSFFGIFFKFFFELFYLNYFKISPGQLLVLVDGRCGGVAVKGEDGVTAGLFRVDLVDPIRPLINFTAMLLSVLSFIY